VVHGLIFTAVYSRHMFVWLSYSQTLAAVIAGCQAAWEFFGGVFAVLIPDNLKPVIAAADAVNPQFTHGWLDYASHAGFVTDPARVRSPKDKPRVERVVQYVRGNFWDGETFTSMDQAQQAATAWCADTAGTRIHGTTCARPLEVFTAEERPRLLAYPGVYDVPVFKAVKVHRDFHAEVAKALYSLPECWIGHMLDVRADSALVKFYHRGKLVKVHLRQPPGGRSTDRADLPEHKAGYALRDLTTLIATCTAHGPKPGSTPSASSTTRCPGPGCAPSTGSKAWCAATAPTASNAHAHYRWTSMSSQSPRSPPCSNAPPRTPPRHCHGQSVKAPRALPVIHPNSPSPQQY
jgi:hypothetical protein